MKRREWLAATAGLAAAGLGMAGCSRAPQRLAFLGGLTGRSADLGVAGRDAVLLAVEEAQHAAGFLDRPLVLDSYDDRQDPAIARALMQALQAAGHELVIGPMTSAVAVVVAPLAAEAGIVLLSPTVTTSALTGRDDHFFRVVSAVDRYARASAGYQAGRLGLRRFALLRDTGNDAYTSTWARAFADAVDGFGARVVTEVAYTYGPDLAVGDLADRLLADGPDAVVIVTNAVDAARVIQALRKRAPLLPLLTSEWAASEQFLELGGRAVEGVVVTQFLDRGSRAPAYLAFVDAFQRRFGRRPGFPEVAAYDAARVGLAALVARRSGETVKQALLRVREFEGVQQLIRLDENGDADREVFVTRVENAGFVQVR